MSNDDKIKLPEVMVFAGPNGSGKSTTSMVPGKMIAFSFWRDS